MTPVDTLMAPWEGFRTCCVFGGEAGEHFIVRAIYGGRGQAAAPGGPR